MEAFLLDSIQISWYRRRDWHILTTGKITYTNDERFQVLHADGSDDWTLLIKFVQKRDNGTYECQVRSALLLGDEISSPSPRVSKYGTDSK